MNEEDRPINIMKISEKKIKDYFKVKENEFFQAGDLIHLIDDEYVKVLEGNPLLKTKVSIHSIVLRKKK